MDKKTTDLQKELEEALAKYRKQWTEGLDCLFDPDNLAKEEILDLYDDLFDELNRVYDSIKTYSQGIYNQLKERDQNEECHLKLVKSNEENG